MLHRGGDEEVHRHVGLDQGNAHDRVDAEDVVQGAGVDGCQRGKFHGSCAVGRAMVDPKGHFELV